jgi:hypothetical protein
MKNKKIWIIIAIFLGVLYLGCKFIYYGSITRSCIYTEKKLPVPQELLSGKVVIAKDAYLAIGKEKARDCLPLFGDINREIVNPEMIDDAQLGKSYFTDQGIKVEKIEKGTVFQVTDIVAVTQHGISTIDTGGGPLYYLILKDQENILYQIAIVELGSSNQKNDLFIAFDSDASNKDNPQLLSWNSFTETEYPQEEGVAYTGKLIELTDEDLKETEPQWKRLLDKLEKGEKFDIGIVLELRDDYADKITLSDNQTERTAQVSSIQNEFLKKIPANIPLRKLEKNQYHPYINAEASPELIDYLVDNKFELKIESISEMVR